MSDYANGLLDDIRKLCSRIETYADKAYREPDYHAVMDSAFVLARTIEALDRHMQRGGVLPDHWQPHLRKAGGG